LLIDGWGRHQVRPSKQLAASPDERFEQRFSASRMAREYES
jgi:hypothetical protein